jgi:hypothetical protein
VHLCRWELPFGDRGSLIMKAYFGPVLVVAAAVFFGLVTILFATGGPSRQNLSPRQIQEVSAEQAEAVSKQARISNLIALATDAALRVIGALVAVLAAVGLVRGVYTGGSAGDQLLSLVAVLAGLMLVDRQWPVAVSIAVVAAAIAATAMIKSLKARPNFEPATVSDSGV